MAIFQRGEIWYVDYYDGKKRVKKVIGKRKTDAIAFLGKVQAAKRENRLFDMKKEHNHTFDELLERYKDAFKNQRSYKDKKHHFPLFEKAFSGKLLAEITPYDLLKLRNERRETPVKTGIERMKKGSRVRGTSPKKTRERKVSTVNREMSTLRHMFSMAVEWEMTERSPFDRAKKIFYKENNVRVRYLSKEEKTALYNVLDIDYLINIVTVALNTGMRKGEILSLKWSQIRNGFIYLTKTKTDEARQLPLNKTLKQLFQSLPRHINSEYVFCDERGNPFKDVRRSFNTALRKTGIKDFHFHDTRHDFASWMIMKGAGLKAVQELLGHKDIKMTMRYAHLEDSYKRQAVELLDEVESQDGEKKVNIKMDAVDLLDDEENQYSPKTVPNRTG